MKEKITTTSGSVYLIDWEAKTWERVRGKDAAKIRSDSGEFIGLSFVEECISMVCPPLFNPDIMRVEDIPSLPLRLITSTKIVSREVVKE